MSLALGGMRVCATAAFSQPPHRPSKGRNPRAMKPTHLKSVERLPGLRLVGRPLRSQTECAVKTADYADYPAMSARTDTGALVLASSSRSHLDRVGRVRMTRN
jgi:hypothetical protein